MKVICISGKAQNGKDTTAKYMEEDLAHRGYRVLIAHYADLVKYICKTFFGWDGEKNELGRRLLQHVGTDIVRAKRPNFWVEFVMSVLDMFQDKWDYVLIPDCRFPNELKCVKDSGFELHHIRVERKNFTSPLTKAQQEHLSETALDNVIADTYIVNDGTLEDLKEKVAFVTADIVGE